MIDKLIKLEDHAAVVQFITSMITDQIGRHKVLLSIYHKNYYFQEKTNSQVMTERGNLD